jgi:peptidoglycan DL-endopeptidase LytE
VKSVAEQLKRVGLATLCAVTLLGAMSSTAMASPSSSSSSTAPSTYTVKSGDSLSGIAAKVGVTLTELLSANGFQKTSVILPGQVIKLPSKSTASASTAVSSLAAKTYAVKSGDSLSGIAAKVGVTLTELLSANGFQKSSVIVPGQIIKLPSSAKVSAPSTASPTVATASTSTRVQKILDFAKAQVGKPYKYGAAGPDAFDCSGLVRAAFKQAGLNVPHSSRELSLMGTSVDWKRDGIRAGDLVFTFSSSTPGQIGHVGIAISSTQWVESPFSGGAVRVANIPTASKIQAVRRLA